MSKCTLHADQAPDHTVPPSPYTDAAGAQFSLLGNMSK